MADMKLITDYQEMMKLVPHMKEQIDIYEEPFIFMLDGIVVVVGELEMWNSGKCVYIKNINSMEYRKGYGKLFIQFLLQQLGKKEIIGESIPDAVPFWFKMGAKFEKQPFQDFLDAEEDEMTGLLIPFTITA